MATPDDLERRLTAVEREVARLREQQGITASDAAAARVLASGADHDVSEVRAELRAHTGALNALRETQLEQGNRLTGVEGRLDRLERKVDDGFARVDENFARVDENFARVDENFARVDENFARVTATLATVQTGLTQVVTLIEGLPTGTGEP